MEGVTGRVNGVKEREQRLRRMQIELGRARLVSRPWELLRQPVKIVPACSPDLEPDLLPSDLCHDSDPCVAEEEEELPPRDPDFNVDLEVDVLCRAGHGSVAAGDRPENLALPSDGSVEMGTAGVGRDDVSNSPDGALGRAYLSHFTPLSTHAAVLEELASTPQSPSPPQLSPIREESISYASVSEDGDVAWKDSGYGLTSLDGLSSVTSPMSVTSPDSEESGVLWQDSRQEMEVGEDPFPALGAFPPPSPAGQHGLSRPVPPLHGLHVPAQGDRTEDRQKAVPEVSRGAADTDHAKPESAGPAFAGGDSAPSHLSLKRKYHFPRDDSDEQFTQDKRDRSSTTELPDSDRNGTGDECDKVLEVDVVEELSTTAPCDAEPRFSWEARASESCEDATDSELCEAEAPALAGLKVNGGIISDKAGDSAETTAGITAHSVRSGDQMSQYLQLYEQSNKLSVESEETSITKDWSRTQTSPDKTDSSQSLCNRDSTPELSCRFTTTPITREDWSGGVDESLPQDDSRESEVCVTHEKTTSNTTEDNPCHSEQSMDSRQPVVEGNECPAHKDWSVRRHNSDGQEGECYSERRALNTQDSGTTITEPADTQPDTVLGKDNDSPASFLMDDHTFHTSTEDNVDLMTPSLMDGLKDTECSPSNIECSPSNTECSPSNTECSPSNTECSPSNTECSPSNTESDHKLYTRLDAIDEGGNDAKNRNRNHATQNHTSDSVSSTDNRVSRFSDRTSSCPEDQQSPSDSVPSPDRNLSPHNISQVENRSHLSSNYDVIQTQQTDSGVTLTKGAISRTQHSIGAGSADGRTKASTDRQSDDQQDRPDDRGSEGEVDMMDYLFYDDRDLISSALSKTSSLDTEPEPEELDGWVGSCSLPEQGSSTDNAEQQPNPCNLSSTNSSGSTISLQSSVQSLHTVSASDYRQRSSIDDNAYSDRKPQLHSADSEGGAMIVSDGLGDLSDTRGVHRMVPASEHITIVESVCTENRPSDLTAAAPAPVTADGDRRLTASDPALCQRDTVIQGGSAESKDSTNGTSTCPINDDNDDNHHHPRDGNMDIHNVVTSSNVIDHVPENKCRSAVQCIEPETVVNTTDADTEVSETNTAMMDSDIVVTESVADTDTSLVTALSEAVTSTSVSSQAVTTVSSAVTNITDTAAPADVNSVTDTTTSSTPPCSRSRSPVSSPTTTTQLTDVTTTPPTTPTSLPATRSSPTVRSAALPPNQRSLGGKKKVLPTSRPRLGQSNKISHLLNKWQAMETAAVPSSSAATTTTTTIIPADSPRHASRLHSSKRHLSRSTPNLAGAESVHGGKAFGCSEHSSSEETEPEHGNSSSSETPLSTNSKPLIHSSTGDLPTLKPQSLKESTKASRPKRSELPEKKTKKVQARKTLPDSPRHDGYKMASLENLKIVLITSDEHSSDNSRTAGSKPAPPSSLRSSGDSSARHEGSDVTSDDKPTLTGLSVQSLISKFDHRDPGGERALGSDRLVMSKHRWSSTPKLQGALSPPPSSSSLSSPGKNPGSATSSSLGHRWTSSSSLSSAGERHRIVSSRPPPKVLYRSCSSITLSPRPASSPSPSPTPTRSVAPGTAVSVSASTHSETSHSETDYRDSQRD
ncbi:uncharacterized protein LOC143286314 [Babylonia areolata]|uniref:uncharacterized protein LOC143286314 n=1 Tax=Babylonia areolata TaxID=304850 RepID=UPI003FD50AB2